MLLICFLQKADSQSNLFTVKKATQIYLASGVLHPSLGFCFPSLCVNVCMYLLSPSFPRKEPGICECMSCRERHLQRRDECFLQTVGRGGEGGTAVCVCVGGWTAPIETLSSNT